MYSLTSKASGGNLVIISLWYFSLFSSVPDASPVKGNDGKTIDLYIACVRSVSQRLYIR